MPKLSNHILASRPTAIRNAGFRFSQRKDGCQAINVAIGNVTLPIHPAMLKRLQLLGTDESPFGSGEVPYSASLGFEETRSAFLHVLEAAGYNTDNLHVQVTDGGSQGMELLLTACCGDAGSSKMPLMVIDPSYTNYNSFAKRLGRRLVSFSRHLEENGNFTLPNFAEIERKIRAEEPNALLVIPYDNPTGQLYTHEMLVELARLCVKYDMWLISDEAYRELYYIDRKDPHGLPISIWGIEEAEVPGITGLRVSLETVSKTWNGCGLRVGALVTDNADLHQRMLNENMANLCCSVLSQWVFGAVAHLDNDDICSWHEEQRTYYGPLTRSFYESMNELLPGVIVSRAEASLYEVVDFRNFVSENFSTDDFVVWCASEGAIDENGSTVTVLTAPLAEFYSVDDENDNPGRTQIRVAFVQPPEVMARVPRLLVGLFRKYLQIHPELSKNWNAGNPAGAVSESRPGQRKATGVPQTQKNFTSLRRKRHSA